MIEIKPIKTTKKGRQRILVMDDNRDMMTLLNRALDLEGYDAVVVGDYNEALNLFKEMNPDMVIMDTFASDDESIHALDTMREQSDVPIVVITTDSQIEALKMTFAHGADDFIRKPFAVRPFIARIRAKLRRYNGKVLQPAC
jgi:DNA-binding response OmpR family regulator